MREMISSDTIACAIEKSTLDAVCDCGHAYEAHRYVAEVARVLRPDGVFLVFSYAPPVSRLCFLEPHFRCDVDVLHEHRCFAYQCRKKTPNV